MITQATEPPKYMTRIRHIREKRGMSQIELAEKIGTSQTMYSRYERGSTELPVRHLVAICRLFGISADYVLGTVSDR